MAQPSRGTDVGSASLLERTFQLKKWGTDTRTEIMAGLATFMTMSYVLAVIPGMLAAAGIPAGPMTVAVILMSSIITIAMGLYANRPFALAPGIGSVAFLAFTLVGINKIPWQVAMGMVFISGIIFLVLTLVGLRELVVKMVPKAIKLSIGAGVGLFLALLGFKNAGIIVANANTNVLVLGKIGQAGPALALIGLAITATLVALKVRGHLLWGILITTAIGIPMGITKVPQSFIKLPESIAPIAFQLDIAGALSLAFFPFMFAFLMSDFFATLGTVLAVGAKGKMLDADGNLPEINKPFLVDAGGTVLGALFAAPVMTTYVESAAGVEAGGRTGLTAVTTGVLFLATLLLTPVALMIPTQATAPALILIGLLMLSVVKQLDLDDFTEALPAFMTMAVSVFTFNFANGIAAGIMAYVLVKTVTGRFKEIHPGLYALTIPLIYYFWLIK